MKNLKTSFCEFPENVMTIFHYTNENLHFIWFHIFFSPFLCEFHFFWCWEELEKCLKADNFHISQDFSQYLNRWIVECWILIIFYSFSSFFTSSEKSWIESRKWDEHEMKKSHLLHCIFNFLIHPHSIHLSLVLFTFYIEKYLKIDVKLNNIFLFEIQTMWKT